MLALKAEREARQRVEEDALRAEMMAKFAEDDRIEQLNAQRRRMKVSTCSSSTAILFLFMYGYYVLEPLPCGRYIGRPTQYTYVVPIRYCT